MEILTWQFLLCFLCGALPTCAVLVWGKAISEADRVEFGIEGRDDFTLPMLASMGVMISLTVREFLSSPAGRLGICIYLIAMLVLIGEGMRRWYCACHRNSTKEDMPPRL